jgi:hypothetical protein
VRLVHDNRELPAGHFRQLAVEAELLQRGDDDLVARSSALTSCLVFLQSL